MSNWGQPRGIERDRRGCAHSGGRQRTEGGGTLGRGEAKSGRSADALLAAYRVGARVAWRELSATAVTAGVSAATVASFAELVFAYIDELSAASVAGHTDELETSGRAREVRVVSGWYGALRNVDITRRAGFDTPRKAGASSKGESSVVHSRARSKGETDAGQPPAPA